MITRQIPLKHDINLENRTVFIMRGTGRLADEITLTGKVFPIDISQKPEGILEFLKTRLI